MVSTRRPAGPAVSRRRLLGLLLVPPALTACSAGVSGEHSAPDPLIALAAAARSDVALAAAAIAATPALADRVEPLRAARAEHAEALDEEIARLAPGRTRAAVPAAATPSASRATLSRLLDAVQAAAGTAAAAVPELPAERVGLVASVAACCATYAAMLG